LGISQLVGNPLFDYYGEPTQDPTEGTPLTGPFDKRPLSDLVNKIWDQPKDGIAYTEKGRLDHSVLSEDEFDLVRKDEITPYPQCFSDMFWKPTATRIDNKYLRGCDDETGQLLKAAPKISESEANVFYDLLSKIFVYNPSDRITAAEMLSHPWFHTDFSSSNAD
jgi:serine/threonine-protein kinase SRPK3